MRSSKKILLSNKRKNQVWNWCKHCCLYWTGILSLRQADCGWVIWHRDRCNCLGSPSM